MSDKGSFDDDPGSQPISENELPTDRELITTPYDATVRSLIDEIGDKSLIVNPEFQRKSVWNTKQKSRLIESLLLNVPIPVIFLAEDDDGTRVVVDGQQRLRTVEEFHSGGFRLQKLEVLSALNGKRWTDLSQRQARMMLSRTIRCILISGKSDPNIRFDVFERLNSGGTPLNDQELRNSLYRGRFNQLLNELANNPLWLETIRRSAPDNRFRHHEMILRFFAVRDIISDYRPPLKYRLNDFMRDHRKDPQPQLDMMRAQFLHALDRVHGIFGNKAFLRPLSATTYSTSINRAIFDVQMLCLNHLTDEQVAARGDQIRGGFLTLCLNNQDFSDSITKATANRSLFYARLRIFLGMLRGRNLPNVQVEEALPPAVQAN